MNVQVGLIIATPMFYVPTLLDPLHVNVDLDLLLTDELVLVREKDFVKFRFI